MTILVLLNKLPHLCYETTTQLLWNNWNCVIKHSIVVIKRCIDVIKQGINVIKQGINVIKHGIDIKQPHW